jgi:GrpE
VWRWLTGFFRSDAEGHAQTEEGDARVSELLDSLRKVVRSNGRLGLRLDAIEAKLEAGLADVRARIVLTTPPPKEPAAVRWDDLLDALDALDRAAESAGAVSSEGMRDGLRAIVARLELIVQQAGITRVSGTGNVPDGRMFRVVGTEAHADRDDGTVVRVVRSAARSGSRVVREGEVVVNKRSV